MDRNEVRLVGRMSETPPRERPMPSGDTLTSWNVIVRRRGGHRRAPFDVVRCVTFDPELGALAKGLAAREQVEVVGSLRSRIFGPPSGKIWTYEVEVASIEAVAQAETGEETEEPVREPEARSPRSVAYLAASA
ncbi:single-stranded DNA-binding protein [Thermoactinospora rubra]|uniref:single-stranded DNA-binding protein n=1 Tax=Thermoactinospora rubra TaxID=1088767 RepID=UPI000A0F88BB|nr:single-stranded DNA-binding protein [Thermoactinospora rubra]